jgi:hypothetical protein
MTRTYSELSQLMTLEDRFDYLVLGGGVGESTFGYSRYINQQFYHSREWRSVRNLVIVRDDGYDLGISDFLIRGAPQIHHMNPLTMEDFEYATDNLMDPEFLIAVSQRTHNAIHYGDRTLLPRSPTVRTAGDTRLW